MKNLKSCIWIIIHLIAIGLWVGIISSGPGAVMVGVGTFFFAAAILGIVGELLLFILETLDHE